MTPTQLAGLALGAAFAAGLNVYATVALLGAAIHFQVAPLPQGLHVLGDPAVILAAGLLFLVEFFADKVPLLDSAWDALHTVVRPLVAAAIGLGAFAGLPPAWQLVAALVAGSVALTAHGAKATTRAAANASPEPFSNWALSTAEDVVAAGLTWLAITHPVVAGALALVFVVLALLVIRGMLRLARRLFTKS